MLTDGHTRQVKLTGVFLQLFVENVPKTAPHYTNTVPLNVSVELGNSYALETHCH